MRGFLLVAFLLSVAACTSSLNEPSVDYPQPSQPSSPLAAPVSVNESLVVNGSSSGEVEGLLQDDLEDAISDLEKLK